LTNNRADGGFDENHVMVAVSLPVLVVHANPQAFARQAHHDSIKVKALLAKDWSSRRFALFRIPP